MSDKLTYKEALDLMLDTNDYIKRLRYKEILEPLVNNSHIVEVLNRIVIIDSGFENKVRLHLPSGKQIDIDYMDLLPINKE